MLMSAGFGTSGDTQVTSILSEETWPNLRSVGAGTADEEEAVRFKVYSKGHSRHILLVFAELNGIRRILAIL